MSKPELLVPAGNFEKLKYAFAYGADAVFAGVPMFSLRARENKFDVDGVAGAIKYTRQLGKTIYLTTNIFAHNYKIDAFMKAMDTMVELKPDAFIMADPGLIMLTKKRHPQAEIHLSVQSNNLNWAQAQFWSEQGVTRIILAREISVAEIAEIHQKVPQIELETFVHGAICMSYSGRCLISNYLAQRDANQGLCAQSCRWQYRVLRSETDDLVTTEKKDYQPLDGNYYLEEAKRPGEYLPIDEDEYGSYLMSSRDLCALQFLPDLKEAGVVSFKVEGRNKTIYYLSQVTRIYRQAIDLMTEGKAIPDSLLDDLAGISNRGFIPGYLTGDLKNKAQQYDGRSYQTHYYCGPVREIDSQAKKIRLDVKHRIAKGEEIEIVMPNGSFGQKITSMSYADDPEAEIEVAHGGHKDVWIAVDRPVEDFALVRKGRGG